MKNGEFNLYKVIDGEYLPVRRPRPWGYSAIGYADFKSGERDEYSFKLEQIYGELEAGLYALVGKWSRREDGEYI